MLSFDRDISKDIEYFERTDFLRKIHKLILKSYLKKGREINIICDNYNAHRHKKVKEWLENQNNVIIHFTPTPA